MEREATVDGDNANPMISVVTAVSRPRNLGRIRRSMEFAVLGSGVRVCWVLVFDPPVPTDPEVTRSITEPGAVEIKPIVYEGGSFKYGIPQKNTGMASIEEGFYYLLDDDNIIHPNLFKRVGAAIRENPGKKAFAFGQIRWDKHGNLFARADLMEPFMVDNSMFIVHRDLIGNDRYDAGYAGMEDFYFFRRLFDRDPGTFVFLDEFLAYYNYMHYFTSGEEGGPLTLAPAPSGPS